MCESYNGDPDNQFLDDGPIHQCSTALFFRIYSTTLCLVLQVRFFTDAGLGVRNDKEL